MSALHAGVTDLTLTHDILTNLDNALGVVVNVVLEVAKS